MSDPIFGEVIHSYSRAQAIEDGVLVDVTEVGREAGFNCSVALTRGAWEKAVAVPEGAEAIGQSESGRLWDVLYLARHAARRGGSQTLYTVSVVTTKGGQRRNVRLKLHAGPGDNAELVITILLPEED